MYQIAVASGKGGAGKTSISAALANWMGKAAISCDCDVDAANTALALGADIQTTETYYSGNAWEIQQNSCTGCGRCVPTCRFGAISMQNGIAFIDEALCERCGNCAGVCPSAAFKPVIKTGGEFFVSKTADEGLLVHAELLPGEDTSGKLVRAVRQKSEQLATEQHTFCIIDAPPGIGCPVIAALQGCNLVLVVIEAGLSGIRDAGRLFELLAGMGRPHASIINKTGIDAGSDAQARQLAERFKSRILTELPYDRRFREASEQGIAWHKYNDSFVAEHSRRLCTAVIHVKGELDGKSHTDR